MFCIKCGKEIPEGGSFCPKCGASVASGKPDAAPKKRRKAAAVLFGVLGVLVLILAIIVIVLVILLRDKTPINEKRGGNKNSFDNSVNLYRGDLSWVEWYITTNFGEDAFDNSRMYELNDPEEEMVIAEIPTQDGTQYYVFMYDGSVSDWYKYNHDAYKMAAEEISTPDKDRSVKITDTDVEWDFWFILNYGKNGLISSIETDYDDIFEYEYDKRGRISKVYYKGEYYEDPTFEEYFYTQSGLLERIEGTIEDESVVEYEYSYEGNKRVEIRSYENVEGFVPGYAQISYNADGKPGDIEVQRLEYGADNALEVTWEYSFSVEYNSDGSVNYKRTRSEKIE